MSAAWVHFQQSLPLFVIIALGYGLIRWARWPESIATGLGQLVFAVVIPALLFRTVSQPEHLRTDPRILIAFFGGCLITFFIGRILAPLLGLNRVEGSVFALGGVFSNNLLLGLPLAQELLGERSVGIVALVLMFNSAILWTLVTVSVEFARHGQASVRGILRSLRSVALNPIVAAIGTGLIFGATGLELPAVLSSPLNMVADSATPLALIALGMTLAQYGIGTQWQVSASITVLKLAVQPLVVLGLCLALGLSPLTTQVLVLLASIAVGANVFLMAQQFKALEGPVASSLVMSTALAAITTPLAVALTGG